MHRQSLSHYPTDFQYNHSRIRVCNHTTYSKLSNLPHAATVKARKKFRRLTRGRLFNSRTHRLFRQL